MSTVASLGTKGEIKRQQVTFRDSELGRILKQVEAILFMAFSAAVLFNYDGPRTKVVNFFEEQRRGSLAWQYLRTLLLEIP